MPNLNDLEEIPRRSLNIFYVLDTSGSMQGEPISYLNTAMRETVSILSEQALTNADAQLKIAVLEFNSGCDWIQKNGPEDAEDFQWIDLQARGITDMGHALEELNGKLSKNGYLSSATGLFLPIIIFMTDGGATDNYKKQLDLIRGNKWFARATKIGFAFGESPDIRMISEVVGNSEAVITTKDLDVFAKFIRVVSVTSSMMCSATSVSTDDVQGVDVVKSAIENDPDQNQNYQVGSDEFKVDVKYDDSMWEDDDWD